MSNLYRYEGDYALLSGRVVDYDYMGRAIGVWIPVDDERLSRVEWEATINKCEHDRIDRHIITDYDGQGVHRDDMKWCPGAAVKGNNDEPS